MRQFRTAQTRVAMLMASVAVGGALLAAQGQQAGPLPLEPNRERGASITPAYEGWYPNPDGSFSMLLGYFNRNQRQTLDIPAGPNNKIEPGPPDQGQPTHFELGRQWGVFVVKVPKDFGKKTLTWTITANGETQAIPFALNPGYVIAPLEEIGMGNKPPVLSFSPGGPTFTGPPTAVAQTLTGKVKTPVQLSIIVEDPKGKGQGEGGGGRGGRGGAGTVANVSLHKFRGPGTVTFDRARLPVTKQGETVAANVTFSDPGEYMLRVQANDESGEGGAGFQCCWTNSYIKVTVTP
jgi:hypothetical protein